jgi:hypothetical protein
MSDGASEGAGEAARAGTSGDDENSGDRVCPECGEPTIPGSDECQHCGAVIETGEGPSLEMWAWAGGILAGFGIFLTPIIAGPPALYCAWKIKKWKPVSARYIVYAVAGTVVFWLFLYPLLYISATS